jgi:hypothetical protein
MPVAKEQPQVGKGQASSGKAEAKTRTKKEEIQKHPPLREEQVSAERKPANRLPKTGEGDQALKERRVERAETREEPVVSKRPHATGEVTLRKESGEDTEAVRENVGNTDANVVGTQEAKRTTDPSRYEKDFEQHYKEHFSKDHFSKDHFSGDSYDDYRRAYHYGYGLATSGAGNWKDVEPQAKQNWETQHPRTWDRFRSAIQYGWGKARDSKG